MRLKALAEIYTMHSFAQLCNLNFCQNFPECLLNFCKLTHLRRLGAELELAPVVPDGEEPGRLHDEPERRISGPVG